ncbi:hypothetical protein OUZ56_008907 [Daphnia magna]|uniref:Uncharacterized protein n=1 Tax=Daphnia magna TaxID=35525 RepID=A0ABR0AEG2_9CRUS|nr:hypothetical protein OUZ56_008907 [Daphnia magna]
MHIDAEISSLKKIAEASRYEMLKELKEKKKRTATSGDPGKCRTRPVPQFAPSSSGQKPKFWNKVHLAL